MSILREHAALGKFRRHLLWVWENESDEYSVKSRDFGSASGMERVTKVWTINARSGTEFG